MSWTRLDDGIYDHPKILEVDPLDRLLYLWALCWSARHRTDGKLRRRAIGHVAALAGVPDLDAAARRLVSAGLWEDDDDGWRVHDFTDYQPTGAEVDELRAKRAEAGRRGGLRSGEARRAASEANGEANPKQTTASGQANPKQTDGAGEANRRSKPAADQDEQPNPKHVPEANPKHLLEVCRTPSRPVPSRPVQIASASSSSGPTHQDRPQPVDDDDVARARLAALELGRRDSDRAGPLRTAPARHRLACADTRWRVQADELIALARQWPDLDPVALADRADHPASGLAPPAPPTTPRFVLCADCGLEHTPAPRCPVVAT